MDPQQLQRLLDCLCDVRNTDELFDLELRFAPFDEEDPVAARALFELAAVRCHLARGPVPSPADVTRSRPAPRSARHRFELRGRVGARIVRVGWADGQLFGSVHALRRLQPGAAALADAMRARQQLRAVFDDVVSEVTVRPRRRRTGTASTATRVRATDAAA